MNGPQLRFEGVIAYNAGDLEEAAHFFEHTLGFEPSGEEGPLRFYGLGDGITGAVDLSGAMAGEPPYLVFSAPDLTAAAEHFLQRGCQVRELPWATGSGFIARSAEGHTVCVVQDDADAPER